jgi:hypothetical protein
VLDDGALKPATAEPPGKFLRPVTLADEGQNKTLVVWNFVNIPSLFFSPLCHNLQKPVAVEIYNLTKPCQTFIFALTLFLQAFLSMSAATGRDAHAN